MAFRSMPTIARPVRAASVVGIYSAGVQRAPATGFSPITIIQIFATALLLIASVLGTKLGGSTITSASCLLILILGLPHGALDIRLLFAAGSTGIQRLSALTLYIAAGAIMALVWWYAPVLALTLFFVTAIAHFAEDWSDIESPFLSHGAALGLLAAPAILHGPMLATLFGAITADGNSAVLGSMLILVSPVAIAVALTALAILWCDQDRQNAAAGLVALLGLIALPPIVGFALFFCLYHSPRHFRKALEPDTWGELHLWNKPVALMTLMALALAAIIYWSAALPSPSARLIRASFITLSILTVPHMLLPRIIGARHLVNWKFLPISKRRR